MSALHNGKLRRKRVFDMIDAPVQHLDYVEADYAVNLAAGKIVARAVHIAPLSVAADGLIGAAEGLA